MAHQSPFADPPESRSPDPDRTPATDVPDLPGCEPFPLTEREIESYDERIEFWDARTGAAWRVRDVTPWHDQPAYR